ncbi:unnamed protein product [Allacma fusca]|uniref:Uncharacterized protein n=1 Tax=Allacma fusca TaxID=39272 RepID=A0A8J2NLM2_9HEXA|nr:unnamed protein product [Allacma fusca]
MGSVSLHSYQNPGFLDQDNGSIRGNQDTPESQSVASLSPRTKSERSAVIKYLQDFNFHNILEELFLFVTLPCLLWLVGFLLTDSECLPGGQVFTLFVLEVGGRIFGYLASWVHCPPMVGMLGVGIAIRNIPYIDFGKNFNSDLSSFLRFEARDILFSRSNSF